MIQTFIEKNRRLLETYCIVARIIGWVLVILSAMPALLIPYIISGIFHEYPGEKYPIDINLMLSGLLKALSGRLPLGIIVLAVSQFIRYVSETKYQPGWLLRHGSGILYLFAFLMITGSIIRHCFLKPVDSSEIMMHLLPDVAVMLILIGLGNILKRIMPMIEESRTLV